MTRNEHNMIELWSSIYVHGVHIKILIYHMFCWLLVLAPHGDQSELLLCFVGVSASVLSRSVLGKTPGLFQVRSALILKLQVPPCECACSRCLCNLGCSWSCAKRLVCTPMIMPYSTVATCQPPPMGQDCQIPKNQRLDFQVIQATISSNPFSM